MTRVPEIDQSLEAKYQENLKKHKEDINRGLAFVAKYGDDFTAELNEVCRSEILTTLRLIQVFLYNDWSTKNDFIRSINREDMTMRELKILKYKELMLQVGSLCRHRRKQQLTPKDFICDCQIGDAANEDQMEAFWDGLWNQLPEKWRTEDFRWHLIRFSYSELPFFIWICRPEPKNPRQILLHKRWMRRFVRTGSGSGETLSVDRN